MCNYKYEFQKTYINALEEINLNGKQIGKTKRKHMKTKINRFETSIYTWKSGTAYSGRD